MTRRIFRFVDYRVDPDPLAALVMQAKCISGDEADCGEKSPEFSEDQQQDMTRWIAKHRAEKGHGRFEETYRRIVVATAKL
ncbi:hypothetical protein ACIBAI_05675 [Streptomyces sp. NPDC051041]|uniref:DUF7848 domain-containing protein n=1 Tax=Streptomyces sp. NPDC051041 TaxID=3365640 RepID=UPI0037BCED07